MIESLPTRTLAELVELRTDKIFHEKDRRLPYVGLEHMAQGAPKLLGTADSGDSVSVNSLFAKDDILFGKLRPNLRKSLLAPFNGYCSTDILVLRCRQGVVPAFAAHVFRWDRVFSAASATAAGTKMPRASWSDLKLVGVFAPESVCEQSRIASVLDVVDAAIAKTEAVIGKLEQLRIGLMQDLLTRGLDGNGTLRDPIRNPEQFAQSPLGLIPKNWQVRGFREFKAPERAYLKTGPFGSSLKQEHWVPEGVPVVTIGSLGEGQFTQSELLHVSEETAQLLSNYALLPGDIVFSRVADVGRSVVVTEAERGWIMSSNMMWISLHQGLADPHYVQANIANNPAVRAQIRTLVNAAGRDVANAAVMNALLLPWAPFDEQRYIVTVVRGLDCDLQSERNELRKLSLLKEGLTADLLTGRVSVSPRLDLPRVYA
jgi:type I restriction enzyme S subunit